MIKMQNVESKYIVEKLWKYNGLDCKVVFNSKFRCGYVRIPKNHPCFNVSYDDIPVEVHGGLTYGGSFNDKKEFWIGFDCSHYGDINIDEKFKEGHYWTLQDTIKEVENLAEQIPKITIDQMVSYKLRYMPEWFKKYLIQKFS